jgi:hypothetical protein
MEQALRIIIAKSSQAGSDAMSCIRAIRVNSPAVQNRYNYVVESAFSDPAASFTAAERALIAQFVELPDDLAGESRENTFRIRLTESERGAIQQQASSAGLTMSEWARRRLFPDSEEQQ